MRKLALLIVMAGALAVPASASAAPVLEVEPTHIPEDLPAGTGVRYEVTVSNSGDATAAGPVSLEFSVPAGYEVIGASAPALFGGFIQTWTCGVQDPQTASCTLVEGIGAEPAAGREACVDNFLQPSPCPVTVDVASDPALVEAGDVLAPTIEVCEDDGTACVSGGDPTDVVAPKEFGVTEFDGGVFDSVGETVTQAGSHPHTGFTGLRLDTILAPLFGQMEEISAEEWKDTFVKLPPGLVGNPEAVGTCTTARLATETCSPESQVGVADIVAGSVIGGSIGNLPTERVEVFKMEAPDGVPAVFAFNFLDNLIFQRADLRSGTDYGLDIQTLNAPQSLPLAGIDFTFWGVPADPSHDGERVGGALPSETPVKPFLALPTSCVGPVDTELRVTSWTGNEASSSFTSHDNLGNPVGNDGCEDLDFEPTLTARPTTEVADSPTGLEVDLQIPQGEGWEDPEANVTAHLRKTEVTLPEGMTINAAGANGLDACSPSEIGLTSDPGETPVAYTPDEADCPDASRVADVVAETPLLDHPVDGSVYLAQPFDNPFDSLLALYLYLEDPESGTIVKLAGEVDPDPDTGRLTTTFDQNPQLPVSEIELEFFGGANAPLVTPQTCGEHTTKSKLTPWSAPASGPPADPADTWEISDSPTGDCVGSERSAPLAPDFDAGTVEPLAGHYSPFVVNLRREDGTQRFKALSLSPPPGLVAKLAGTAYCPEAALAAAAAKDGKAEERSPSCPPASRVGSVFAAAGAGPAPYHAPGAAYLAGPYKGAPLSVATIAPATAGPFDLGTVVVRTALHVDRRTAEITALTDDFPRILQGVPLNLRSVSIRLDKPQFTKNPTSCDVKAVGGHLFSVLGAVAGLAERFQLAECTRLGFRPRVFLRLFGKRFGRGANPRLRAIVLPRPGDANISRTAVKMPSSIFVDQSHIRTVCTRVQFAAGACPQAAIYGFARAFSPLLDRPLQGPVYLRSSDNTLPDLVADLRGQVNVEVVGRTDSVKGALRNTFDVVPDAPVSKFVLMLQAGRKSLLVASRNLCAGAQRARINMSAHNGAQRLSRQPIAIPRCKQIRGAAEKRRAAKRRARRAALSAAGRSR